MKKDRKTSVGKSARSELIRRIATLPPDKRILLERKLEALRAASPRSDAIPKREDLRSMPLSFAQERMWFLSQYEAGVPTYNRLLCFRLIGDLNLSALQRSVEGLVERHEVLRATFSSVEGRPVQREADPFSRGSTSFVTVVDLRDVADRNREDAARRACESAGREPFDLQKGPLFRVSVFRYGDEEHLLLLNSHHIVADGWSDVVMLEELSGLYDAFVHSEAAELPDLSIQYADFAAWQRQWLQGAVLDEQLAYWIERLHGAPSLELPTDRSRPPTQTFRGECYRFELDAEMTSQLQALGRESGATPYMILLSGFALLLSRLSGQADVVLGSLIANRNRSEIERLIGTFVNALVLRIGVQGEQTVQELLSHVREITLEAQSHQDLPFEKLVEELRPNRELSRTPLFQVLFILQISPAKSLVLPGLDVAPCEVHSGASNYDLTLAVEETGEGLVGCWEYASDLFDSSTIRRLHGHFEILLKEIVNDPSRRVSTISLLTDADRHRLLFEWNDTHADFPLEACFHELFERQVRRTPDAIAVGLGGMDGQGESRISYRELNRRANRFAREFIDKGVARCSLVAVLLDRGIDFLATILAVFKAGAAYVPLDPLHPPARLRRVLEDSEARLVVCETHYSSAVAQALAEVAFEARPGVLLVEGLSEVERSERDLPPWAIAEDLSYVIYTSGSTGTPKGAMVEHRGMLNHLFAKVDDLHLSSDDRVAQSASACFDISVWQFLSPLLVGGEVRVYPDEVVHEPMVLLRALQRDEISVFEAVPSPLQAMLEEARRSGDGARDLPALRSLLVTGEALPPELCREWLAGSEIPMTNAWGPTECSDDITHYTLERPPKATVTNIPIGTALPNMEMYVLDARMEPVPIGVPGELHVGGICVGRGYVNHPAWTAQRFVPHPFARQTGMRLYRTGDLGRYRSEDRTVEFLGRMDHQVKIRGFRIETGEIESILGRHPEVSHCVVVALDSSTQNLGASEKRLVAYVVWKGAGEVEAKNLRCFLKKELPGYMVPSAFVSLPALPLLVSGKVDLRALPDPGVAQEDQRSSFVAPRTSTERVVAQIWAEVLRREEVGVGENFFDLGGHSLLATQIASRLREKFETSVSPREVFELPTVEEIARWLDEHAASTKGEGTSIRRVDRASSLPLSSVQQRLWFIDRWEMDQATYNVPAAFRISGPLDVEVLHRCLDQIVERHEILRTVFPSRGGVPEQRILPATGAWFRRVDLSGLSESRREAACSELLRRESGLPFDLATGPLLRSFVVRLAEETHLLLFVMHHIVTDDWSVGVFMGELAGLYRAGLEGSCPCLPELRVQYADFAHWQRRDSAEKELESGLAYWRSQLGGSLAPIELPTDFPRPPVQLREGGCSIVEFPPSLSDELRELSRREGVTLFTLIYAGFQTLLHRLTAQREIVVGTPVANRDHRETEPLIGCFLNTLVLRTNFQGDLTFREVLHRSRKTTLEAFEHKSVPFERVLEELQPTRDLSRMPLFQVMFALQHGSSGDFALEGTSTQVVRVHSGTSKFDLTLLILDEGDKLLGLWEYDVHLFTPATIERFHRQFRTLLEGIVADVDRRLREFPLLTKEERCRLIVDGSGPPMVRPKEDCLHFEFERLSSRVPDVAAVVAGQRVLTFGELNVRANRLAHRLIVLGVGPEVVVGLSMPRSIETVVALLAIWKAGGAYFALDPSYPDERLSALVGQAAPRVILTDREVGARLRESGIKAFVLEEEEASIAAQKRENPQRRATGANLAYVLYTSGSTGVPKGVIVEHASLSNLCEAQVQHLGIPRGGGRILQFSSFAFDAHLFELVMALRNGNTVVLGTAEELTPGPRLVRLLGDRQVSAATLTPTVLSALPESPLPGLETLMVAGEACRAELVTRWGEGRRFFNLYGPAEATVWSTFVECRGEEAGDPPIGRPIGNAQAYVLDGDLVLSPVGVEGEVCLGGANLARGYLGDPKSTARSFVPHPLGSESGARLYRSGDRAAWSADGQIFFRGRIDRQVKVRGQRVEPGETEKVLGGHPAIRDLVVSEHRAPGGGAELIAYIVAATPTPPAAGEYRAFLARKLPRAMIPARFVAIDEIPMNASGKLDRSALPDPEGFHSPSGPSFVAPGSALEREIADIWKGVLSLDRVGVHDNFFDLGGHSLRLAEVHERLNQTARAITMLDLFEHPTIRSLVGFLSSERENPTEKETDRGSLRVASLRRKREHRVRERRR